VVAPTLETPVAFLIFNRPGTTGRVFEAIRAARPRRLLVVADGPRPSRPGEAELCRATRAVLERVDWRCEVQTRFSEENLGCRRRISSGLSWVFEQVEEAIVLEDDCLPEPSFFPYCAELLERYRRDERVAFVSGTSYQFGRRRGPYSYFFSRYPHVWGWAGWRRTWRRYDVDMALWPEARDAGWLEQLHDRRFVRGFWRTMFDDTYAGRVDTWDYQLVFACQAAGALSVTPEVNLVRNVGFGDGATRTTRRNRFAEMPAAPMPFPLRHPPFVVRHREADEETENSQHLAPVLPVRLLRAWWKVRRRLGGGPGAP